MLHCNLEICCVNIHQRKDFLDLINLIADEKSIEPFLVEKDYWIMHVLYGLRKQGFDFELTMYRQTNQLLSVPGHMIE